MHNSLLCEIQAFNTAVSFLHFSRSSHFLIVSPLSGLTFHVYRINPAKEIRGDYKNRYFLLYKLHRGVTTAEINDITISDDEKIVIVSSSRGTCHIYKINPQNISLSYNHEVFCRIKLGSFLENSFFLRSHIIVSKKMQPKTKGALSNAVLEPCPCEVTMITSLGMLCKYTIETSPVMISSSFIARNKNFKEIKVQTPLPIHQKNNSNDIEFAEITYNGWIPLSRSPQFCLYNTPDTYPEKIAGDLDLLIFNEDKPFPGFTVHYDKSSRLQEAMDAEIPSTQIISQEIDHQFLENSAPTFKIYLDEHFYP